MLAKQSRVPPAGNSSVSEIRRRLLFLLVRAFGIVVFLSFLFFTIAIGYFLTTPSSPVLSDVANTLEAYYLAKGSWEGVDEVFVSSDRFESRNNALLVDNNYHLILDRREDPTLTIGSPYRVQDNDLVHPLMVRGQTVGYLVLQQSSIADRFMFVGAVFIPITIIMFFLAVFLVIVATLLIRRFINPLADLIFAAREVADGKLNTRIPKKGPQDLQSLSESFNEMASSLERSDRERRDMLADIAHELRTPLSVIRGRLEGIVDGIYSDNGSQISMALEQTYLLQRLVDDLRLLTLAETRQLQFDKRDVNVGNVVERVLEMFSAEAQEKNILLSFPEMNGNLSAFIDPQRFEQILGNLIGNSLRYVPEGGSGKIWITANETHHRVRLTVNDNGPGISDEDLPFIFDRFWRKEKSRARATGGTGLGLAIAKQLIESQDGTIQARNLPEGGLQIELQLGKVTSQ
jgi:two-component system OmpR family sensor kinase/two-component system sensor histidine kinase BaeS